MKLLYVLTYYTPHLSGLTRGVEPIATHFGARHDVEVLTARHDPGLPTREVTGDVTITRVPVAFRIGKGPVMPGFFRAAWNAAGRADLVHIIAPQLEAGLMALIARLRGKKVVLSYICSMRLGGAAGILATLALWLSHGLAGLCAHRIVALSEDYAGQSLFCRLFRRKLTYIPVPIPNFGTPEDAHRTATPPFRIGFVGRLSPEKNIGLLLDAIPFLRERLGSGFTMELVGPDEPEGTPGAAALQQRLNTADLPELRRLGQLSEEELDRFYRQIDVLVLPSVDRIEAYGMVQVEAMLRGTPCVTSDRPGMREPIQLTGFGKVFKAGSAPALADAVTDVLLQGPPTVPSPAEIRDTFDPRKIYAQFEQLYGDVMDRQPQGAKLP